MYYIQIELLTNRSKSLLYAIVTELIRKAFLTISKKHFHLLRPEFVVVVIVVVELSNDDDNNKGNSDDLRNDNDGE